VWRCIPSPELISLDSGSIRRAATESTANGRTDLRSNIACKQAGKARNPLSYRNALNERFVDRTQPLRRLARESQEDGTTRKENIRQMPSPYPANAELS